MSIVQEFRQHPEQVLDRLVDGELGIDDRRGLLAALDDEPGAWRQCALAFVEAQALGWQLSRIAHEPIVARESSSGRLAHSGQVTSARRAGWLAWPLSLAAAVMVAFLVGQQVAERQEGSPAAVDTAVEGSASPTIESDQATAVARTDETDPAEVDRAPNGVALNPGVGEDAREQPADGEPGRSQAITGALAQQFQRDGFEVDRQQQFWPVELPDGSSVLVPVEEMHIQTPDVQRL
jgi:hypothetical protein